MWTLSLTLLFSSGSAGSPSMTSIPGFATEEACLKAATKWVSAIVPQNKILIPIPVCMASTLQARSL